MMTMELMAQKPVETSARGKKDILRCIEDQMAILLADYPESQVEVRSKTGRYGKGLSIFVWIAPKSETD
mgnify:CR=1 FL=1